MRNVIYVSQDATDIGLKWVEGDPVSLVITVLGVDWTGTYEAQVREDKSAVSDFLATLTITATLSGSDTEFLVELDPNTVPAGDHYWTCREVGGVTRFRGPVIVKPDTIGAES